MPEHKKEESNEKVNNSSAKKSVLSTVRKNPWILVSVVLAIIVIISLFTGGIGSSAVSSKTAGENLVKFINAQGQGTASVVSSVKQGELYKVTVDFNGQQIPVFVTLDGIYLITNPVSLSGAENIDTTTGSGTDTTTSIDPSQIPISADTPVTGNANAKVTVVEFSDFSCPFCAAASGDNAEMTSYMKQNSPSWEPIVTNMMKDYVQTGKVRFAAFYSMGHSGGHPAQSVAWCLNDQSSALYWKFYPKAFENQADVEDLSKMIALAKTLGGADMTKLQTCLDSKKYDSRFATEQSLGVSVGVQGTPAFFINGRLVSGAVPYSQVKAIIEAELAK